MNRKRKALGLALAAVMAMAAFSTATASADFETEVHHALLFTAPPEGVKDVYTFNAGTVTCNTTYSGTVSSTEVSEVTVLPHYTNCTAFGFVNATIDVNGCTYTWTTTTTPTPATAVRLHIRCSPGAAITVTAFNCHVKVSSQTRTGITYTNLGSGKTRDIYVHGNIPGYEYTQESKSFPGCTNGTFTNGTYKGAATITATDTVGNHVGIWTTHAS